jgi:hypothetical protein
MKGKIGHFVVEDAAEHTQCLWHVAALENAGQTI